MKLSVWKIGFAAGCLIISLLGGKAQSFGYGEKSDGAQTIDAMQNQPGSNLITPLETLELRGENSREAQDLSTADNPTNDQADKGKKFEWNFYWKKWEGLYFLVGQKIEFGGPESFIPSRVDQEIKVTGKIGVKLAFDAAAFAHDKDLGDVNDGVEFRRVRLYAQGDLFFFTLPASYKLEWGLTGGRMYFEENFVTFPNIPAVGTVTIGNFQTPMTLEGVASSRDITFMEPSSPIQAFAPGVKFGIQTARTAFNERVTWAAGLFADGFARDIGDASQALGRVIGRATWLPLYNEDPVSPELIHLGLGGNYLLLPYGDVRYQSRPEAHLAPNLVDTGNIPAENAFSLSAEAAWVKGPYSLQGEYLHAFIKEKDGGNFNFKGFYVSGSWFLTGESRPYDKASGVFGKVLPKKNLSIKNGGLGAWELGVRYSHLDLNDGPVQGGRMNILMGGLNWYWNPVFKLRLNLGYGDIDKGASSGYLYIFQTRLEMNF